MSEDEVLALFLSLLLALFGIVRWYRPLLTVNPSAPGALVRAVLFLVPLAGLAGLAWVLFHYAALEVRGAREYFVLFMLAGAGWMALAAAGMSALGVSFREDAIENRNPAAAAVACGAVWGSMLCFAGCNAGEGQTIWTTFFPAAVATTILWLLWFIFAFSSDVTDAVTIDRDMASGIRLAGLLVACGVILGRAGAGDWHGTGTMLADMARDGWPAAALAAVAVIVQWVFRPTPPAPNAAVVRCGLFPALAFVGAAAGHVWVLGGP